MNNNHKAIICVILLIVLIIINVMLSIFRMIFNPFYTLGDMIYDVFIFPTILVMSASFGIFIAKMCNQIKINTAKLESLDIPSI